MSSVGTVSEPLPEELGGWAFSSRESLTNYEERCRSSNFIFHLRSLLPLASSFNHGPRSYMEITITAQQHREKHLGLGEARFKSKYFESCSPPTQKLLTEVGLTVWEGTTGTTELGPVKMNGTV